ncbi:MAG: acetyl-CoA hydrolase [Gammaproteobacteria bacterium]|nr:acetyl-CoA hydrolase [Gammaproteobacteria bacterium]
MTRRISAEQVPALLEPGMNVFVMGGPNEPRGIIEALRAQPERCAGVRFFQSIVPGMTDTDFCAIHPQVRSSAYFITPGTREPYLRGRLDYIPMQISAVTDFLASDYPLDLAILGLSGPADATIFGGGLNVDFLDVILQRRPPVVAELNHRLPTPHDATSLPAACVDYVVETEHALPQLPLPEPTQESVWIAHHVAALVKDGDCIQTGVGAIPYSVLHALGDKNDLGLHSGILDDAGMALIEAGNITGSRKPIDRFKHVVACAMGTADFYDRAASHPHVRFRPFGHTHAARVLVGLDNFVSINSAMEIDLQGQMNAEMINGSQVTGTGGAVDFMRGAAGSPGGRSIIAMTATAAAGRRSRIVARLGDGNAATALRTDVDYVVTEHGARRLRFLSERDRARALIEIAAPQFRDELEQAFERRHQAP